MKKCLMGFIGSLVVFISTLATGQTDDTKRHPERHAVLCLIVPAIRFERIVQRGPQKLLDELTQMTFGVNFWFAKYRHKFQINYLKDFLQVSFG